MKKYIIAFVILGFAILASSVQAIDYTTNSNIIIKPAVLNTGGSGAASIKVTPVSSGMVTAYTALQIREKIAAVKMQMALMQAQLTRLEAALKEAELKGSVQLNLSGMTNASAGSSLDASLKNLKLNAISRMLYLGQKGDDVRKLQEILKARGYLNANADGSFGPKTLEALSAYQRAMKLKVSGAVDADTLNTINAEATSSASVETQ